MKKFQDQRRNKYFVMRSMNYKRRYVEKEEGVTGRMGSQCVSCITNFFIFLLVDMCLNTQQSFF